MRSAGSDDAPGEGRSEVAGGAPSRTTGTGATHKQRRSGPSGATRPSTPQARPAARRDEEGRVGGPAVVALGGGHGLAVALTAIRQYGGTITAVVTVADDGGSSGRLRRDFGTPAPGDIRRALVALAANDTWARTFEHRFDGGELDGHAFGNLALLSLASTMGDFVAAIDEAGRLLGTVGRVLPATAGPVVLRADVEGEMVEGQVNVGMAAGKIRSVELIPSDAPGCAQAISAVEHADQIVLAPGSLYTSLLPVLAVPSLRDAVLNARGKVVQVCNVRCETPETDDMDATDHLRAVIAHGARVDSFLYQAFGVLAADEETIRLLGAEPVGSDVVDDARMAHDPAKLAKALRALL